MTPDELRRAIEQGPPAGNTAQLDPIGVPGDYTATREIPARPDTQEWRGVPYRSDVTATKHHPARVRQIAPRYFEGDDWAPASLPPEKIREIQRRMVAAGLIPKGAEYRIGYWDETTRQGYRQLLAEANGAGLAANQQLKIREDTTEANKQKSAATSVYLRPDPARQRSTVRSLIKGTLGESHQITDQEIEHLTGVINSFDRSGFDADVAAEAAAESATDDTGAAVVQDVDPEARLEEYIRTQYRPEIKHNAEVVDMTKSRESLFGNVFALDQMIEG